MKATINGIKVIGTPAEIAEFIRITTPKVECQEYQTLSNGFVMQPNYFPSDKERDAWVKEYENLMKRIDDQADLLLLKECIDNKSTPWLKPIHPIEPIKPNATKRTKRKP